MDITRFLLATAYARAVVDSDSTWEIKFNVVFEMVAPAIAESGIKVEYHDPDTSYEEDVMAYVNALELKAADLRKLPHP